MVIYVALNVEECKYAVFSYKIWFALVVRISKFGKNPASYVSSDKFEYASISYAILYVATCPVKYKRAPNSYKNYDKCELCLVGIVISTRIHIEPGK